MSDKRYKNWEDKGWQDMSGLLDEYMPQRKKRRRVMVFWCLLAGVLLGLLGSGLWWGLGTLPMADPPPRSIPEARDVRDVANVTPAKQDCVESAESPTSEVMALEEDAPDMVRQAQRHERVGEATLKKEKRMVSYPPAMRNLPLPSGGVVGQHTEANGQIPELAAQPRGRKEADKPIIVHSNNSPLPVATMMPLAVQWPALLLEKEYPALSLLEVSPLAPSPKWSWGGQGGYLFSHAKAMGGQVAGFAQWDWGRKWYLRLGLGYQYLSLGSDMDELLTEESLRNISADNFFDLEERVARPTEAIDWRRHYVQVPLTLGYRLGRNVSLQVGVSGSYMIPATQVVEAESIDFENLGVGSPTYATQDVAYRLSPVWDVHGSLGLEYRLPRGWGVGLAYSQGLRRQYLWDETHGVKSAMQGYFARNRYLSLSLVRNW